MAFPAMAGQSLLSERDRTAYSDAFEAIGKKQFGRARLLAEQAENPMPGKVIRWLDLIRTRSDGDQASFSEFAEFLDQNPGWPSQTSLQRAAERAMADDLPDERVLAWFGRRPPLTVDGTLRYAAALLRAGESERAVKLLGQAWIGLNFDQEQEIAFRQRYKQLITPEDEIARLERLLWQRSDNAARRQAKRIDNGYVELTDARLRLARRRPGVDSAIKRVPAHLKNNPGLNFERALWRQRKGRAEGVIELLDPPRTDVAYPELWWRLRRRAVRWAIDNGDHAAAQRIASHHGVDHGLVFAEGEWLAGWIALRFLKDPKQAYQHFVRLHDGVSSPISRARGAYWAGEAAAAKGTAKWAKHWHRLAAQHSTTYYGQLAARRLGQEPSVVLPQSVRPTLEERAKFDRQELVYVVRLLGELDQRKAQKRFLDHMRQTAGGAADFQLVAELADSQGRPDIALRTAKDARMAGFILSDQLYPKPPLQAIDGLNPALMFALIRQESQFYPEAVSGSGARGLMQLMPATAKLVAKGLNLTYRRDKLTEDPIFNLKLGSAYLIQLLERFDGTVMLALASYNAGPHRVQQWIKNYGDPRRAEVDAVDWAERIPFSETRNYVQRILETVPVYETRLNSRRANLPLKRASALRPGPRREVFSNN